MECNKDEAARAKEIAVKKLTEKDIAGAKKFAVKAQNLFPGLEGLSQLQATLDVYISAERRIDGDVDWYGVLGLDPLADDDTIRKHYRKLALSLHPDKNKSAGAEGAFKIVSEAWSLLSDKSKKIIYDQRRKLRNIYPNVPVSNTSVPAGKNGFHSFSSSKYPTSRNHYTATRPPTTPANPTSTAQRPQKSSTFWTICISCKVQYEYLRIYLNNTLLCPNCRKAFTATEMPSPPTSVSSPWTDFHRRQNNNQPTNKNLHEGTRTSPFSGTQSARAVQPPSMKSKRGREEAPQADLRQEALRRKFNSSRKAGAGLADGSMKQNRMDGGEMSSQMPSGNRGLGMGGSPGYQQVVSETEKITVSAWSRPNVTRELSPLELRNMQMEKAKKEILQKMNEWRSMASASKTADTSKTSDKPKTSDKEESTKNEETPKSTANALGTEEKKPTVSTDTSIKSQAAKSSPGMDNNADSGTKVIETLSMSVPDPDFHDFDMDRTEKSFASNQVWAAYDDDDGMPRYYAMVHEVISLEPFKMRISWLNSKSNSELAPLSWIGSGFYKTSGDFRIGKYEVYKSLNSFSHKVNWIKSAKGIIHIYPKKGDVWALYRNWAPDWNQHTPDEVIHKYDMVEVLEDYDEDRGVTVAPLVKVVGFKTVFRRHMDPKTFKTIPREELFRLSHQVPSYLLTGREAQNAPKDCRELDPAAIPLELLQVITEWKEEEGKLEDNHRTKVNESMENGKGIEGEDREGNKAG